MTIRRSISSWVFSACLAACGANTAPTAPDAGDGGTIVADAGVDGSGSTDGGGGGGSDAGGLDDAPPFTQGASTLAGTDEAGDVDGSRSVARFSNPVNVAYRNGLVVVADFDNNRLRVIDAGTHVTSTIVTPSGFARPFGLAFAADGTLYVLTDNDPRGGHSAMSGTIWKVDLTAASVSVVVESIGRPRGLAVLPDGRLALSDYQHHVIELFDPATMALNVIAGAWDMPGQADGTGDVARFTAPYGLGVDGDGLIAAGYGDHSIRRIAFDGTTVTLAGSGLPDFVDGSLGAARFNHPQGIAVTASGDIYVADGGNFRVRRIAGNTVTTAAGNGQDGYLDHDDPLLAQFHGLEGLTAVPDGSMLYMADGNRGEGLAFNRVRQVRLH